MWLSISLSTSDLESSDESVDSGSGGLNDQSSSSSDEHQHHQHHQYRSQQWAKKPQSQSSHHTTLKPIPPKEYNGSADAWSYHWFFKESEVYLCNGKVHHRQRVFMLSYYLSGKAYDFYTQKVSINEEEWTIPQFYTKLFNYCFPINYQMQMHQALAHCHENDKTVAEYTHDLQELSNMIGDIPEQYKVIKFWNGSRPVLQKGLWHNNLNPEILTWDAVVNQAEIIEISENVAEWQDCKSSQSMSHGLTGHIHINGENWLSANPQDWAI